MAHMNHGGLPMSVLHGHSPPPYTFVTSNLIFLPKIWSKSVVHSPDLFAETLKRHITTIPSSITTTLHNGSLPSKFSCPLADINPPLPSKLTQRLRQSLREGCLFQNNSWMKWEAVQLADELEAKEAMVKADWGCWKKSEE